MRVQIRSKSGFTLVELMIVLGILALLTVIAFPNYIRYRGTAERNICIQNLHKIEAAKQTWGLERLRQTGDEPSSDELYGLTGYIKVKPTCPTTGLDYHINPIGTDASCDQPEHSL